jgi:hypothetical protein
MKALFKALSATLGIAITMALFAGVFFTPANAQCVGPSLMMKRGGATFEQQSWTGRDGSASLFKESPSMLQSPLLGEDLSPAAFTPVAYADVEDMPSAAREPIVGFWYVKFTSDTPGAFFDWGYSQYHSDGTEILNSGTGARKFCTGVWKKTGPSEYKLNHFAIAYSFGTPPTFVGIVNIRATMTANSDHNSFAGTFTVGIYDQSGNLLEPPDGPGLVTGRIQGRRITVDTPVTDVLPAVP